MTRPDPHDERKATICSLPVVALLAAGLLAHQVDARASALGEVSQLSAVGQPLRVEIRSSVADLQPGCLHTATGAPPTDGIPQAAVGRFDVRRDGGSSRIVVTHPAPVSDPILRLIIENRCGTRMTRAYTLLLPHPSALTAAPTLQQPASRTMPPEPPPRPARPTPSSGTRWTTAPGESVNSLAQALYPRDAAARRAFVSAVLRDNPQLFAGVPGDSASATLPAGTPFLVPSPGRVVAATTQPAPQRPTATTVAAAPRVAGTTHGAPATVERPRADRLMLQGDETPARSAPPSTQSPPSGAGEAQQLLREESLVDAIDRTINVQLELLDRIGRLEAIQQALRSQVDTPLAEPLMPIAATRQRAAAHEPAGIAAGAVEATPTSGSMATDVPRDNLWMLFGLIAVGLAGALMIRRLTAAPERPAPRYRTPPASVLPEPPAERADREVAPRSSPMTIAPSPQAGLAWDARDSHAPPSQAPIAADDAIEDHDSAIELAEIMVSFGRIQGAADTLADFVRANPKQAVTPWLKLMELYYRTQKREAFETLARHLNKAFNVSPISWENFGASHRYTHTIEHLPHIAGQLTNLWRTRECQAYIERLLRDNRDGTRQGFPLGVIDELLMLSGVLEAELGRYKAPADA